MKKKISNKRGSTMKNTKSKVSKVMNKTLGNTL